MLNRNNQPAIHTLDQISIMEPEKYTLDNGIDVYQFDSGTQDLLMIELIFKAGTWQQEEPFSALGTNLMLREGTKALTSQQISEKLDYYGAHLETSVEKDHAFVTLFTLNKHLTETLTVLEDIIKNASFPEQECSVIIGKQRQTLAINMQKVSYLARTRFTSLLFGRQHPYGQTIQPEDLEINGTDQFARFHRLYYHAANCRMLVAGKIPAGFQMMLQQHFGGNDWLREVQPEVHFAAEPSAEKEIFIQKDDALQSAIRMGREMFNRNHPDFIAMHFLNTLLGGYFGSRLMSNLREDKGFTYGIGSGIVPFDHSGFFFISAEVGSQVTRQAVQEIENELNKLCSEDVNEKELELVRNYLQGSFLRSIDGPFALADRYRDVLLSGYDMNYYNQMLEIERNITPRQLREHAARYLNPKEMYLLIAGKQA